MNIPIFNFLYSFAFRSPVLDGLIWFLAVPFIYIIMVVIGLYFFIKYDIYKVRTIAELWRGKGREVIEIFFSGGLAYILAKILKMFIQTDRPFVALSNVQALFFESDYAFPSGHSATIMAIAVSVYFKNKKLGYICFFATLLIGIARVASGVHFPIDILGGYLLGFLVAFSINKLH